MNCYEIHDWIENELRWYIKIMGYDIDKHEILGDTLNIYLKNSNSGIKLENPIKKKIPNKFGKGEWKAKNLKDAKEMAIDFRNSVS